MRLLVLLLVLALKIVSCGSNTPSLTWVTNKYCYSPLRFDVQRTPLVVVVRPYMNVIVCIMGTNPDAASGYKAKGLHV